MAENHTTLARAWEEACSRVLEIELKGWEREFKGRLGTVDLVLRSPETGERIIGEFKLFLSPYIPGHWLARAFSQIDINARRFTARSAYLLTSSRLSEGQGRGFSTSVPVHIFDVDAVRRIASQDAELLETIDTILAKAGIDVSKEVLESTAPGSVAASQQTSTDFNAERLPEAGGERLCQELRAVKQAGRNFAEYEAKVAEVLGFLFADDLDGWARQTHDEDDLRYDISARILKRHEFWKTLASDFRTRFVLFECKNYPAPISQAEVHSTEKYLFPAALRSFAIIVSPHGVDGGAKGAMKGALRESGKLITWLSNDDICEMLVAHDKGDELYGLLSERLDRMLLTISR